MFESFYKDKRLFVTGHTGFKGSWLCLLLHKLGAQVSGYALTPPTQPSLYEAAGIDALVDSTIGDIRNYDLLLETLERIQPEIVIHMAAQPLVRESYKNPRETYAIRPWQHVLEPLTGYLTLAEKLYSQGARFAEGWNFGPEDSDARNVEWITKTICELWGDNASYSGEYCGME
jgi:hypothetical protein